MAVTSIVGETGMFLSGCTKKARQKRREIRPDVTAVISYSCPRSVGGAGQRVTHLLRNRPSGLRPTDGNQSRIICRAALFQKCLRSYVRLSLFAGYFQPSRAEGNILIDCQDYTSSLQRYNIHKATYCLQPKLSFFMKQNRVSQKTMSRLNICSVLLVEGKGQFSPKVYFMCQNQNRGNPSEKGCKY